MSLDDQRLEGAVQGNSISGGIHIFYGNTAAYAYMDDLTEEALIEAASGGPA